MSSKEIAISLGLSPQTVDTYLKSAMARLGATNRRDAARIFAALEHSQKSGLPTEPLAERQISALSADADTTGSQPQFARSIIGLPPIGGQINDLTWIERNHAIFRVAATGLSVIIALVLIIAGLLWIFS